jgi:pimeloyl-ACP methyl ester carboxylesterase
MNVTSDTTGDGVRERSFRVGGVPGVLWSAAGGAGRRPLVLLGHGGSQHSRAPRLAARARRFVTSCGFTAAAIDAPGYGGRPPSADDEEFIAAIREQMATGLPVDAQIADYNAGLAEQAVPEWVAVLDALQELGEIGPGRPVGYWGLSLGTLLGLPLVAAEPRIGAAVLGLAGARSLAAAAARVTVPVEFLLQWDDELVPRASALALFDALGSHEKSLHANPGRHRDVPPFEADSADRFFRRHLR